MRSTSVQLALYSATLMASQQVYGANSVEESLNLANEVLCRTWKQTLYLSKVTKGEGWTRTGLAETAKYFDKEGIEITDWTKFDGYKTSGCEEADSAYFVATTGVAMLTAAISTLMF